MNRFLLIAVFFCVSVIGISQETEQKQAEIKYFDKEFFLIEGTRISELEKESPYDRLPASYKEKVRVPVWNLSKSSAGISVRFYSNSTRIKVKWTVMNDNKMNHMAETGIKGVDLYFNNNSRWQYINTGRPSGLENEATLVSNMTGEMREYKLYLPLYDGVTNLEIGIDENSLIEKPVMSDEKPIVFYGTSITQGGCASRPGMVHTSIISRKLNIDCINFGFSGNGRMEKEIVELISEIDAAFYVIECLPNMNSQQVEERTIPLVELIRTKHPETPIILVENLIYENAFLDEKYRIEIEDKNQVLENQYKKIIELGVGNVLYINSVGAIGFSHEGTVDGVHFTDLGFQLYADYLVKSFVDFGLVRTVTRYHMMEKD